MKNQEKEKDFFLIAKKITKQQQTSNGLQMQLDQRYQKESQQALKMINAYRKVQNIKTNQIHHSKIKKDEQNPPQISHQTKSSYANKIKQTLRQLNANKAKQYEKLSQKNSQINSNKNIKSLQVNNQMAILAKSQNQKKLISKASQKFWNLFISITKRLQKQSFQFIIESSERNLLQDYNMAKKYRIFRLFSLWKEQTKINKIENEKRRKQQSDKQIEGQQLSKEFYAFKTCRKIMKSWLRVTNNQKKKRVYQQELKIKVLNENIKNKKQEKAPITVQTNENGPLQNKLRGFLDGLKQKIQHKETKPKLQSIQERNEQSQKNSAVFSQTGHQQIHNIEESNQNQQINHQPVQQNPNDHTQSSSQPQKPLSNEELQKKRLQINERSKNRKNALQKLKKEKQISKKKQEQERRQLQKKIDEQQKRIKQLKYKEFQQRKKLQREWQIRQNQLNNRAEQWNKLRILKYYGFDHWKNVKIINAQKTIKLSQVLQRIMLKHAGQELIEILRQNLNVILSDLYTKMKFIYQSNLRRKALKGYQLEKDQCNQQKIKLEAFHQVHLQKIFLSQWKSTMDILRLENLQEQRPLLKKAYDYHKVSLMLKSLRELKKNAIESKKEKNIKDQKLKIKSKIKGIINEKIEINFQQFL